MAKITTIIVVVFLSLSMFVSIVFAENVETSLSNLDAFSLQGLMHITIDTKTSRKQKDVSSTVYVYTSDDIVKHGWNSLSDIFQHIPGVDYSFNGSGYFVSARGVPDYTLNGSKTVVMIDGHDMSNSSFNSISYQGFQKHFDVRNAKRIEILVGPGSTLHGANAYGLVVNIITRDVGDTAVSDMTLSYGSNNDDVLSASVSKRWGKWAGFMSATRWMQDSGDLAEIPIRNTNGVTEVYNNDSYDDNYVDNATVHAYIDYQNLARAGFIVTKENNGFGTSFVATEVGRKISKQNMLYLDINYLYSASLEYRLKSHYRNSKIGRGDILLALESDDRRTTIQAESDSLVLDNLIIYRVADTVRILGGLFTEFTNQSPIAAKSVAYSQDYEFAPKPQKENWDNYALYAQAEWNPGDKLRTTLGVRYINSIEQYDSEVLPRLGLVYTLPQGINLKFNYQRGYRPPSIGEVGNTASFYFRNENISSETIDTIEFGLFSEFAGHNALHANFYYSKLRDVIKRENISIATDPAITVWDVNGDAISVVGSEFGAKVIITDKTQVSIEFSQTSSTTEGGQSLNKMITPNKINFNLDAEPVNDININVDIYVRLDPATSEDNTLYQGGSAPDWYVVDFNMLANNLFDVKKLSVMFLVKNLLNESYGLVERRSSHPRYPDYHPQPKRSALLSFRYKL